jgi:hypothetical protein
VFRWVLLPGPELAVFFLLQCATRSCLQQQRRTLCCA